MVIMGSFLCSRTAVEHPVRTFVLSAIIAEHSFGVKRQNEKRQKEKNVRINVRKRSG